MEIVMNEGNCAKAAEEFFIFGGPGVRGTSPFRASFEGMIRDSMGYGIGMGKTQPAPVGNSSTPICDMVVKDIEARKAMGTMKYGTPLQAGNGRDAKRDAYEEALDLVIYLRQAKEEEKLASKEKPHAKNIMESFRTMQHAVHVNAKNHGWWDKPREDGTNLMLIVSELAEAVEALREGNPRDEQCPEFSHAEIELADVVIRVMDFCERKGWNLGRAVMAKHEFNMGREHMHGGKLF